ncbi:MAG: hypothetical protein Q8M07_08315 [Prosthecobacter sp.]|nr:hypothetical protein [Prosthecobacter sp.]
MTIRTDRLIICEGKMVEGRTTMEALLAALHHETSAYAHLRDLPTARLHIEVWPVADDHGLAAAATKEGA